MVLHSFFKQFPWLPTIVHNLSAFFIFHWLSCFLIFYSLSSAYFFPVSHPLYYFLFPSFSVIFHHISSSPTCSSKFNLLLTSHLVPAFFHHVPHSSIFLYGCASFLIIFIVFMILHGFHHFWTVINFVFFLSFHDSYVRFHQCFSSIFVVFHRSS